jgi:C1A family cysteine protease
VGVPAAFDLRSVDGRNFVTGIRDQLSCGACVAFASVAAIESTYRVESGNADSAIDLSEAHLFYCHGGAVGRTCDSGWIPNEALSACRDTGISDDACFPYTPGDQSCDGRCSDWQDRAVRITSFQQLASRADMKAWLVDHGPLTACFVVFDDFFNYVGGVYRHVTGAEAGGHAVAIVGYDDAESCWICKNSWGADWGEQGFFRIAYGECEIDAWQVCGVQGVLVPTQQAARTVRGLWAVANSRNAWAYLDGLGWRRIASDSDAIMVNLLAELAAAKGANRPVDVKLEQDVIREVYVR